jgi:hypothetical protein
LVLDLALMVERPGLLVAAVALALYRATLAEPTTEGMGAGELVRALASVANQRRSQAADLGLHLTD